MIVYDRKGITADGCAVGLDGEGTTEDMEYTIETVACIGCCALAPCVTVNEEVHGNLSRKKVRTLLAKGSKSNGS